MNETKRTALEQGLQQAGIAWEAARPLALDTTLRIGGPAALSAAPEREEALIGALRLARQLEIPVLVVGNGSNLLVSDRGFAGLVLRTEGLRQLRQDGTRLYAGCGVGLNRLATCARDAALAGLSFAYGIPGTVGGAVCMNAGAYGGQMADVLVESRYYDPAQDRVVTLTAEEHAFSYRHSVYLDYPERTVLSATFALQPGDRDALAAEMQELMQRRRDKQPMEYPSAGSTFKRPEGYFAGALIEQCGLKGFSVGGAQVSEKHAGFLINRGGATADDMRRLMEHVQRCVLARTGVRLEPEVQYVESGDEV